jgi:hypothetical protein
MRTVKVYRRKPGSHEVYKSAEMPNIPEDWTAQDILKRFGIRSHLKIVVCEDSKPDWIVQNFEPQN